MTRPLQAVLAVVVVVAGLVVQFLTRMVTIDDIGLAAIFGGLGALAVIVPALLTEPSPRSGERAGEPPPSSRQ